MESLMYNIAFQPSQQTFKMTSITREARGTYEMEANIASLTSTLEQTCSPQNWCKTSTKPRLWPLVMVGILRVLVLYGPVGMRHHVNMADWKIRWFPWCQHTKTRRFLLRCGRPGPRSVWPWLPSAIRMATPTSGGWCGGAVIPHLADVTSIFGDFVQPRGILLPVWSCFSGCDVFFSSNKMTTGEGEGEFQRECRICWILTKMNWLVLLQPTNFVFIPCKDFQVPWFSKALWIVWQVQIPNKLGAQPDSVAIQRFQAQIFYACGNKKAFPTSSFLHILWKITSLGLVSFGWKWKHLLLKNGWFNCFKHSFLHDQICRLETDALWAPDIFQQKVLSETVGTPKKESSNGVEWTNK